MPEQQIYIYISSSNGITEDGLIINIDGMGNRVSSLIYGHERVLIVLGINKISKNREESLRRIKSKACPENAKRLNLNTPCKILNKCTDCNSKDRMCNVTVILEKAPMDSDISVFIINKSMGF